MTSFKRPLRAGAIAGASVLAMALAMPVMASELTPSSGSTVTVPQNPDVGGGYRPDPTRKTVGEMERDIAEGKYNTPSQGQSSGDMNKIGETGSGQPQRQGATLPSGPGRPMGDATQPGSGSAYSSPSGSTASGTGVSAGAAGNLQIDRVNVQELSPNLQAAVRERMGPRQTTSELVETTILNRLALLGTDYRLNNARKVGADYVLIIDGPAGKQSTMIYEASSGNLREVQM